MPRNWWSDPWNCFLFFLLGFCAGAFVATYDWVYGTLLVVNVASVMLQYGAMLNRQRREDAQAAAAHVMKIWMTGGE
jgi:hypothetical protein